ncbi:lipocalin-like domain-containing protein [Xylariaceae sp. FL0016]|nr:lipocalin-like domain-containing protein [Xylariaceae sp. FL0016]
MHLSALLVSSSLTALAASWPTLSPRQDNGTDAANVTSAVYDGSCFYPTAGADFPDDLSEYLGRWYQVAGTPAIFTLGCKCIYAEYGLNDDGTVSVHNACQLGVLPNSIEGTATAVSADYAAKGAFQVSFSSVPGGGVICPGPNYIVQKYDPNWAIVQSPRFETLFLLSREQNPADEDIDAWLEEAGKLGTNLDTVTKVSQENCLFT